MPELRNLSFRPLPEGKAAKNNSMGDVSADAASTLAGRVEYAIRLANTGVWEGTTGYNSLERR